MHHWHNRYNCGMILDHDFPVITLTSLPLQQRPVRQPDLGNLRAKGVDVYPENCTRPDVEEDQQAKTANLRLRLCPRRFFGRSFICFWSQCF
jgi:hypothetical protein